MSLPKAACGWRVCDTIASMGGGRIWVGRERWLAQRKRLWQATGRFGRTLEGKVTFSVVAHALVLFVLINGWWFGIRRLRPAGTANGSQMAIAYVPARSVAAQKAVRRLPPPKVLSPALTLPVAPSETVDAPAAEAVEALGSGTIGIEYVQGFPRQRPDLTAAGVTGDVVIDIQIDDNGHVAQIHQREGMGPGVDDMVIATVQQWIFRPAIKNGRAVSSERELHFHYDRRRDPSGCGWECFALEDR